MTGTEKVKRYLDFPLDRRHQESVERNLVFQAQTALVGICVMIMSSQVLMMIFMGARAGGPFATPRRSVYFLLYIALFAVSFASWVAARILARDLQNNSRLYLRLVTCYSAFIAFWGCGITFLDQLEGSGGNVYTYVILSLAAFAMLRPWQAILIFSSSALLLNGLLLQSPAGAEDLFSSVVNSAFVVVLAVSISIMLYRYRVFSCYDQMVIGRQVEEIRQINRELHRQVMEDELTQMHNRRYLEEVISAQLGQNWAQGRPAAGMMVDIDYFKPYNDHYGHQRGDVCLREVARTIMAFAEEEGGSAVRYGGEEFLVCFLDCGPERAQELAETLCRRVRERQLVREDAHGPCVMVSVGLYVGVKGGLQEFVERTDRALYRAKKNGRGRVEVYREGEPLAHGEHTSLSEEFL